MSARRMLLTLLLLAAMAGGGAALAQEEAETDVVFRPIVRPRSGTPVWMDVEFDTKATALLQGCLEVTITNASQPVAHYCTSDMALTAGKQTFRMLLPGSSETLQSAQSTIRSAFRTQQGRIGFRPQPVGLPHQGLREFVVCVAASDIELRLVAGDIASSLRLEHYDPESVPMAERTYVTHLDGLAPQEFPASPLLCCCFDIAVLPANGFARLQARQLDALRSWVEGGGSICVLPRNGLKGYHEQFLNDLTGRPEGLFLLDTAGAVGTAGPTEDVVMLRAGLGRAVVVVPDAQDNLDTASASWRQAVAFLWKLKAEQRETFVQEGKWRVEKPDESSRSRRYSYRDAWWEEEDRAFGHVPLEATVALQQCLMPEGVRMMPAGILLLLFIGFVVAIGPLDYWLLGRLRKRTLTWLLFPALSIGVAGLVVYLSEHYMGSQDYVSAVIFIDVDRGGRSLRWSRCEMMYAGRAHTEQTRVQNALCGGLGEVSTPYGRRWGYGGPSEPALLYTGRLPFDFVITRQISQWKPAFIRATSFESLAGPSRLNWQALQEADVTTHRGRALAAEQLCRGTSFDGGRLCVSGGAISRIRGSVRGLDRPRSSADPWTLEDFLVQVSARAAKGCFSLVSQMSPGCTATLEDLSLLDPTDPEQRLLVAVERVGADYYVYRCLLCGEP